MKAAPSTPAHEATYQEISALIRRSEASGLTALEVLAIAANVVGKIIALQDQTTVTPEQAMEVVAKNIELGNAQVIDELMKSEGSA